MLEHWGGPTGRRNDPGAEDKMARLLEPWRAAELPVIYTQHDSREASSPLKLHLPTGEMLKGFGPRGGEIVIRMVVNSGLVGTKMELRMLEHGITRLVIVGFLPNFCVATTAHMSGNMGYDTYRVPDTRATTNRVGPDGTDYDSEVVHAISVASLHDEFCTAISPDQAIDLTKADAPELTRAQGNE